MSSQSLPKAIQDKLLDLEKKIKNLTAHSYIIKVGWFEKEMAKIAKIQEFGAHITVTDKMRRFLGWKFGIHLKKTTTMITIPPRPHMKNVVEKNIAKWKKELAKQLEKNKFDLEKSLKVMGMVMAQDYKKSFFEDGVFQELAGATIAIRQQKDIGGTLPLVATNEMQRQIKSEVIKQ